MKITSVESFNIEIPITAEQEAERAVNAGEATLAEEAARFLETRCGRKAGSESATGPGSTPRYSAPQSEGTGRRRQ